MSVFPLAVGIVIKKFFFSSNKNKIMASHGDKFNTLQMFNVLDKVEFIQQKEAKYLVYRKGDNKVLKSVNYSPADLKSILDS